MSLLNQVLQDLEKRKATGDIAEPFQINHVKAVTVTPKKTPYLLFTLIVLTCFIAILSYFLFIRQSVNIDPPALQQTPVIAAKEVVTPASQNITIKESQQKKPALQLAKKPQVLTKNLAKKIKPKQHAVNNKVATQQAQVTQIKIPQTPIKQTLKSQAIKTLSPEQKAEKFYKTAEKQHNIIEQQRNLESTLKLNPQHINARLLLSSILLQQGLTEKTTNILEQGLSLFPKNMRLINLRSQLLLQNKQAQIALTLLHRLDATYVQDETYLSLLASAYQQNNNNENSLNVYQKLVTINPKKAEYWLGLAISLEKQGNTRQALNAYQQALNKNTLKIVIVSYIKQRISILK